MTIEDYCISLNPNNFFLVVLGVVDMCHDLLKIYLIIEIKDDRIQFDHIIKSPGWMKSIQVYQVLELFSIMIEFDTVISNKAMILWMAMMQKTALMILFKVNFSKMYNRHISDVSRPSTVIWMVQ